MIHRHKAMHPMQESFDESLVEKLGNRSIDYFYEETKSNQHL